MRLTLRTLLAFMDDILDPQDAHDIGEKINKSEYAQGLARRIRDVHRRRQLAAPDLTGPGARLDPNTVAEYLDNTLPPERVPAVEKVCLDSDAHLAEAAACHQVLSLVLTEAAEIRPESRRRMYGLVSEPAAAAPAEAAAGVSAEQSVAAQSSAAPKPQPLAAGRGWLVPALVTAGVVLLVAIVWAVVGLPGSGSPEVAQMTPPAGEQTGTGKPAPESTPATPEKEAPAPSEKTAPTEPASQPEAAPEPGAAKLEEPPARAEEPAEPTPPPAAAQKAESAAPAEPAKPEPVEETKHPETPGPSELGQYVAAAQVLLLYNAEREQWDRLPGRSKMYSTDRLVALPGFRPVIGLADSGDNLEVVGTADAGFYGTEVVMFPATDSASFGIRIASGRVVLTSAKGQSVFDLQFGRSVDGHGLPQWQLRLLQAGTRVGIEYRLIPPVGYQPQRAMTAQATLYVESGRAELVQADASHSFDAPATHVILQQGENAPNTPVQLADTSWISNPTQSRLQRRAAHIVEEQIPVRLEQPQQDEKSVTLSLIEQSRSDEEEVKHLAVQCLAALGKADVLADVLDTAQGERGEPARREAIAGLRYWIARGAEPAEQLRELLVRQRGSEEGQLRFRLLWGYSQAAQQEPATMDEVLDLLTHNDLGVRELAAYNLRTITGTTSGYHAHETLAERERDVQQLRGSHAKGNLVPRRREL